MRCLLVLALLLTGCTSAPAWRAMSYEQEDAAYSRARTQALAAVALDVASTGVALSRGGHEVGVFGGTGHTGAIVGTAATGALAIVLCEAAHRQGWTRQAIGVLRFTSVVRVGFAVNNMREMR
jgi:hypothetical protein